MLKRAPMKKLFPILAFSLASLWLGCTKELSSETGSKPPGNNAEGQLIGAPGACSNIEVKGVYGQSIASDTSHYLLVELNFSKAGDYIIQTDTVNGLFFADTGSVSNTGVALLKLQAFGAPLNPGTFNFTLRFKASICSFVLNVYPVVSSSGTDYFPTTANSWWNYISNNPSAGPADTLRSVATGTTITQALTGKQYDIFRNIYLNGSVVDSSYYRKSQGDYFAFGDLDLFGLTDLPVEGEWSFLKDNLNAGGSWNSAEFVAVLAGQPVKMRLKMDLLRKNVDAIVGNKIYRNVIQVRTTIQFQLSAMAPFTDALSTESWYAKGIGLINVVAPAPYYGYRVQQFVVN